MSESKTKPFSMPYYLPVGSGARPIRMAQLRMFDEEWEAFQGLCEDESVTMAHAIWCLAKFFVATTPEQRSKILGAERLARISPRRKS